MCTRVTKTPINSIYIFVSSVNTSMGFSRFISSSLITKVRVMNQSLDPCTQVTRDVDPMLDYWNSWASGAEVAGPTVSRHWYNVSCLLGRSMNNQRQCMNWITTDHDNCNNMSWMAGHYQRVNWKQTLPNGQGGCIHCAGMKNNGEIDGDFNEVMIQLVGGLVYYVVNAYEPLRNLALL